MKTIIRTSIAGVLSMLCMAAGAQDLKSAYFLDGYYYRHQMNPAIGNDSVTYLSFPGFGNINIAEHGSFGVSDVLLDNPMYPNKSDKKLTTFLNPYIPADKALAGFDKGNNRFLTDINLAILSAGWRGWGGYNTVELNFRFNEGSSLPFELFEFAKNTGNKHYDIGDLSVEANCFAEVALGHSRNINDKLRVGAKLKLLVGVAKADLAMKGLTADLSGTDKWTLQGDAQMNVSMKGFKYKSERKDYETEGAGSYECVNDADVDGGGVSGFGAAVDLGVTYKVMDNLTLSASLIDLGAISWQNCYLAENKVKRFEFSGFHDIDVKKGDPNTPGKQADKYSDQLADFFNLQDRGDTGGRTTGLGATMHLGAEYVLPGYDKLSFGLLNSTRFNGDYSWTEFRASANWKPLKWLDGALTAATGTFGTTAGWVMNIHPKGFGVFLGVDYLIGSVSEQMIPLNPNMTLSLGMNFAW